MVYDRIRVRSQCWVCCCFTTSSPFNLRRVFTIFYTFATNIGNDVSLQVMVKGGKAPSVGDAESQKAIIGEAAISIRSDVNVVEEFVG